MSGWLPRGTNDCVRSVLTGAIFSVHGESYQVTWRPDINERNKQTNNIGKCYEM